jgi:hypothetical protein
VEITFMKNQGIKLLIIALTILSVFGCGKKGGGGGSTAKPPSSTATCTGGLCTSGGNLGNIGRSVWSGQLRVSDMTRFRQFMVDSGGCANTNECQGLQSYLDLAVGLVDGYVPGQGAFQLNTYRGSNGYGSGSCRLNANNIPVAASSNNRGILVNYNIGYTMNSCNGGGGNRQYFRYDPRNNQQNRNGGNLQIVLDLGARRNTGSQYNNSGYSQYNQVSTSIYYRGARIATGTLVDYNYGNSIMTGGRGNNYRNNDFMYVNGGDDYYYGGGGYDDYVTYRKRMEGYHEDDDDDDDLKYFALKILDKWLDRKFYTGGHGDDGYYERN